MSNIVSPREQHHITSTEFPISFHMKKRQSKESSWILFSCKHHIVTMFKTPARTNPKLSGNMCREVVYDCFTVMSWCGRLYRYLTPFCVPFFVQFCQVHPTVRNLNSGIEMSQSVYLVLNANSTRKLHHVTHVSNVSNFKWFWV